MGSFTSKYIYPNLSTGNFWAGKKRKGCDRDNDSPCGTHSRKKMKLNSSIDQKYIYDELFNGGVYSDIKIVACEHKWNLHKVYLKQCPYFASMLSGAWKETGQDVINIDVVDPNITVEALNTIFGSLYLNEIVLNCANLVPVMAAAAHFGMDNMINRCADLMMESISCKTVLSYYSVAEQYGSPTVKEAAFRYLLQNIVHSKHHWALLPNISLDTMVEIVSSPDLFVVTTEYHVYQLLLRWLYLQINPNDDKRIKDCELKDYFSRLSGKDPFLSTPEGAKYVPAFKRLRLRNLFATHNVISHIYDTRVIPWQWITDSVYDCHLELLEVHDGVDKGPDQADVEDVKSKGVRFGRVLKRDGVTWRWPGVLAGVQLCWSIAENVIEVSRCRPQEFAMLVSTMRNRKLIIRVRTKTITKRYSPKILESTNVLSLSLGEKVEVLRLPVNYRYPILVAVDILLRKAND